MNSTLQDNERLKKDFYIHSLKRRQVEEQRERFVELIWCKSNFETMFQFQEFNFLVKIFDVQFFQEFLRESELYGLRREIQVMMNDRRTNRAKYTQIQKRISCLKKLKFLQISSFKKSLSVTYFKVSPFESVNHNLESIFENQFQNFLDRGTRLEGKPDAMRDSLTDQQNKNI